MCLPKKYKCSKCGRDMRSFDKYSCHCCPDHPNGKSYKYFKIAKHYPESDWDGDIYGLHHLQYLIDHQ